LIDDVAQSKIESIEQAYREAQEQITGEVVENGLNELREHTAAIASAIPNAIDEEVARYGSRTGANIVGLQAQAAEIRRRPQRRANQAENTFYIELTRLMQRDAISNRTNLPAGVSQGVGKPIFIGHGRSLLWRELKDFLTERLGLEWEEFNREATAGRSTKERLEEMLNKAAFAFIVMTAEDESKSGDLHPRANVVHEAGLFQGRLGFSRAIILFEDGCAEFSNIHGLTQIRFPRGNISASFEEIRRVLEREGMLATGGTTTVEPPGPRERLSTVPILRQGLPSEAGVAAAVQPAIERQSKRSLPVTQEGLTVRIDSGHDQGFLIMVESHADQEFEIVGASVESNGSQLGRINLPPPDQRWVLPPRGRQMIRWADDIRPVQALINVKGQYRNDFTEFVDFVFQCILEDEDRTFRKKVKVRVDPLNRNLTQII
jgi:predicted nucleotide-binding protein